MPNRLHLFRTHKPAHKPDAVSGTEPAHATRTDDAPQPHSAGGETATLLRSLTRLFVKINRARARFTGDRGGRSASPPNPRPEASKRNASPVSDSTRNPSPVSGVRNASVSSGSFSLHGVPQILRDLHSSRSLSLSGNQQATDLSIHGRASSLSLSENRIRTLADPSPPLPAALLQPSHPFASLPRPVTDTAELRRLLQAQLRRQPTGLVESHLDVMLGICRAFDLIIGLRPINPMAGYLLREMNYPTKPFAIKAKTAKTGPAAGHLEILPGDAGVAKVLQAGHAIAQPLLLTGERINELLEAHLLDYDALSPPILDDGNLLHSETLWFTCPVSGRNWVFRNLPTDQWGYLAGKVNNTSVWSVHQPDSRGKAGETVRILAHPELGLPFTADYDLLTFGLPVAPDGESPLNTLPPIDVESSLVDLINARRSIAGRPSLDLTSVSGRATPVSTSGSLAEDPVWGNASPLLRTLAESINACINRGGDPRLNLIHHNADCHNPFSSENSIYPALFLLPNAAARTLESILPAAHPTAAEHLNRLQSVCSTRRIRTEATEWNNWGAVWVRNPAEFNRLAATAYGHGYRIKKSQAWLGGELPKAATAPFRIR